MDRYTDYDPFAWLYANYWGDDFHREALPALDRLLLHRLPKSAAVLDLCCGDGRISLELHCRGFRVTGLDGSERMLTLAKQRAPKVRFLLADARCFQISEEFDAVISTFDSLNHVLESRELRKVFDNVHHALKSEGWFVFDLNREQAYLDFWAHNSHTVDADAVSVARGVYDDQTRLATCDVTLFEKQGPSWERSDFRLTQRYHPPETVMAALKRAGFSAERLDAAVDLKMQGDTGHGRDFYLARKRSPSKSS
jgi:SAM-dependent methyltransferase